MKTKKRLAVMLALLIVCAGVLAGCGGETPDATEPTEKTLTGISITTPPAKTEYLAGETFDPAGMVVTASYSDSTTEEVTGYAVDKEALAAEDTAVTVTYEGKTAQQAVTVTAERSLVIAFWCEQEGGEPLNFYSDGTVIISESQEYATTLNWTMGENGVIDVQVPDAYAGYVTVTSYHANGKAIVNVDAAMGGVTLYSYPLGEYKALFDLQPEVIATIENGGNVLKLFDTGTYEMTVDGTTTTGEAVYTEAADGAKASFVLKPESGAEIAATTGEYDSNFNILDQFVIPDGRLRHILGYSVAGYEGEQIGLYLFPDNTASLIFETENGISEYPCTYSFNNTDLEALVLDITCPVPVLYGGPELSCVYSSADDEFTFTAVQGETTYELKLNGTDVNDDLGGYAVVPVLYEFAAVSAAKANGDPVDGSAIKFQILKGGACKVTMYNAYTESDMDLGSGAWQFSAADGFGYSLSGSYIENGFTYGGLSAENRTITMNTAGMQSIATMTFELTAEQWTELATALS